MTEESNQNDMMVQWKDIENMLAQRLDHLNRIRIHPTTQTSSVRYLATTTQITVNESVEERVVQLRDNLTTLKTAVMRKEVRVIQHVIITIVRTVTHWLETIEYRVYTIKQTDSIDRRIEEIHGLNEEIRIVEENLQTLKEVTELAVEVVNEETKLLMHNVVHSLQRQAQSVKEVTKRGESEIHRNQRKWDDYLKKISSVDEQIQALKSQLQQLQTTDLTLSNQDRLKQLEEIETQIEEKLLTVNELLQTGSYLQI